MDVCVILDTCTNVRLCMRESRRENFPVYVRASASAFACIILCACANVCMCLPMRVCTSSYACVYMRMCEREYACIRAYSMK